MIKVLIMGWGIPSLLVPDVHSIASRFETVQSLDVLGTLPAYLWARYVLD
jgi:hypothetical protein